MGGFCPLEGLRVMVVNLHKAEIIRFQLVHTRKDPSVQGSAFQLGKPALHGIQPGATSGRELPVETQVFVQPLQYILRFVRAAVIHHQMQS
jgi:hypothetical protein